jgi:hypothetical protein
MLKMKYFDVLTPREQDVIRVMHFGRTNDLGLSPEYFLEVLNEARSKLGWSPDSKPFRKR